MFTQSACKEIWIRKLEFVSKNSIPFFTTNLIKEMFGNMSIYSRQGIIEKIDISVIVNGSSYRYSLPLASREIGT